MRQRYFSDSLPDKSMYLLYQECGVGFFCCCWVWEFVVVVLFWCVFYFNEENGFRQSCLVLQSTRDNAARILAMHHYLLFLTNITAANGLCL